MRTQSDTIGVNVSMQHSQAAQRALPPQVIRTAREGVQELWTDAHAQIAKLRPEVLERETPFTPNASIQSVNSRLAERSKLRFEVRPLANACRRTMLPPFACDLGCRWQLNLAWCSYPPTILWRPCRVRWHAAWRP